MTSPVPTILVAEPVVQALTMAATSPSIRMLRCIVVRRIMSPPRVGWMPPLLDLVLHRGNALQVARDGLEIRLRQVLESGRRPLDHLAHEAGCPSAGTSRSAPRSSRGPFPSPV